MSWIFWLALLPLSAACVADVRWRLIPDWASLALFVLGLVVVATATSPLTAFGGGMIGIAFGVAAAVFGFWGWGDAKLFAGAALIAGPGALAFLVAGMALTGAAMALAILSLRPAARRYAARSTGSTFPRWVRNEMRRCRMAPSIPYAIAITGGVLSILKV